ncbi:MAG: dipeptidase [Aeropyrum sp.]|nr:dipeptidase [Aeropyrum sp.]MCE4616505.1 dipeptidase [Aeropyrum sp.]
MSYPIVDLHEDIAFYYMTGGLGAKAQRFDLDVEGREADIPKYNRANVRIVFAALFPQIEVYGFKERTSYPTPASSRLIMLDQLKTLYALSRLHEIEIITSIKEVKSIMGSGEWRLGLILHLEGADPLLDVLDLEVLWRLGVRSVGLTWNHDNMWAASCRTRKDYGLTGSGEELVREAGRLGIIVDLAHASDKTVLDVAAISRKPVIVSHTNFRWFVDNPRNVSEEMVEAVIKTGGVIGYSFIGSLITLGRRPTIDDVVAQILDFVERFGYQWIAIGTDYHGLIGVDPPIGLESIDKLPDLLDALGEAGLGDKELSALTYGNISRVLSEVLGD